MRKRIIGVMDRRVTPAAREKEESFLYAAFVADPAREGTSVYIVIGEAQSFTLGKQKRQHVN